MKFCTTFFMFFITMSLFNDLFAQQEMMMQRFRIDGVDRKIGVVSDSNDSLYFAIYPGEDPLNRRNMSYFTSGGAFIISEPRPCRLADIVSQHPSKLYVMGATYSPELMWNITLADNSNARMAGPIDNEASMDIIRQLKLYPDDSDEVQIDGGEIARAMPTSIGRISYDDTEYNTFNGSQMFYRYLGAINYLDDELKAEKARNDELEERLDEMETILEQLLTSKPQTIPTETLDKKSQILKVYPNPTNSDIYIEMKFQETGKNAELRIIDLQGNIVLTKSLNGTEESIQLNLNQLNLTNGQYICVLMSDGQVTDTQSISLVK